MLELKECSSARAAAVRSSTLLLPDPNITATALRRWLVVGTMEDTSELEPFSLVSQEHDMVSSLIEGFIGLSGLCIQSNGDEIGIKKG